MAKKKSSSIISIPSFLSGAVVGCLVSLFIFEVGSSRLADIQPDTSAFPNIEDAFPDTRFEFYDTLRANPTASNGKQPTELVLANEDTLESAPTSTGDVETSSDAQESTAESASSGSELKGYILQAGSFHDENHANSFRASLLLEGYNAYSTRVEIENAGVRFRVIVGPYTTREEGERDIARLRMRNVSALLLEMRQDSR